MDVLRFFILIFFSVSILSAQDYTTILWDSNNKLTWENFKGKIPLHSRAAATTASGVTYKYSAQRIRGELNVSFIVSAYFYPKKSWYNPSLCDSLILSHEQLHFDISELYARKLKRKLDATTFTHGSLKKEVKSIYNVVMAELNSYQNLYDKETNFSRDLEEQLRWNKKIREALK
ncbi:uncharacterized protein DUF922 [Maribacter vaceletii]|uniref:Uncharacterized protein DUF922 n=1 Tax=Maribacter vaceletii TaxID=1206816 RepID=A0A495DSN7_9FLAO|nr:DUF922 domain-containing protein [Maribacter vaceletii]RKR06497.1 uncharacterized protein DUF922 [Maribacter vaceletii]